MEEKAEGYKPGTKFLFLVDYFEASSILDDWMEGCYACDLRMRRAKTAKRIVVEVADVMVASMIRRYHPTAKVAIVKPGEGK